MGRPAFFEIILPASIGAEVRDLGRDEIEDAVGEALAVAGVGEVTGGGTGVTGSLIDVDVTDFDRALPIIRDVLRGLNVPSDVVISHNEGDFLAGSGKRTFYKVFD